MSNNNLAGSVKDTSTEDHTHTANNPLSESRSGKSSQAKVLVLPRSPKNQGDA